MLPEVGQVSAGDDATLAQVLDELLAQVVELAADPTAAILGIDGDVRSVVPRSVGVVVSAMVVPGDLGNGVLGMIEIEIDENAGTLADHPVTVEHYEETLWKELGVRLDVGLRHQLGRFGCRKGGGLQTGTRRSKGGRHRGVDELVHTGPVPRERR